MQSLFPGAEADVPAPVRHDGPFAGVALEQSVDKVLDYAIPRALIDTIRVGQRVRVPLGRGNKPARGYVVSIHPTTTYAKIKSLSAIEDTRALLSDKLLELARWMSRYYLCPLGTVIQSIIPAAVKKRVGLGHSQQVALAMSREEVQDLVEKTKAPKRRAILARLLQLEPNQTIELKRLASEAGATSATVRKLALLRVVTIRQVEDMLSLSSAIPESPGDEPPIPLNPDQRKVFDDLAPRLLNQFSVNLLYGVTGSGKTEVYLQAIRKVVDAGKQAIVLVPEIALTPQTVRRFTARFQRVAVLHSGLGATARHRFWQQISEGQAQVVIGARSAIFAPLPNLGIVIVDEEHESSYKQDTAPRYHGRDIAIKRAQLEGIPIILGSATPSLEMWERVHRGDAEARRKGIDHQGHEDTRDTKEEKSGLVEGQQTNASANPLSPSPSSPRLSVSAVNTYSLLPLPVRVSGLALPTVELVDMKVDRSLRKGVHLISARLEKVLNHTVAQKQQAIILLNRRGYSNFVHCPSCQHLMQCKYCDTTMTYHRSAGADPHSASSAQGVHTGQLHCHYCLAVNPLPSMCPACGKKLSLFGLGTQRVEEEMHKKFPNLRFVRVDSDSMRQAGDYEKVLKQFGAGEIDVLLGTQMIAKGLHYPNVTLVGVISGDTSLSLPDFRASERTFQLITQVAGRAGRGASAGRVIVQTLLPDDPTIRFAMKQDYEGFAKAELASRKDVGLPPYKRMVRIIFRDEDPEKLNNLSDKVANLLTDAIQTSSAPVEMKGPMPCAIGRIAGYYRNQVVLSAKDPRYLQSVLLTVREKGGLAKSDKVAVDVDPVSLL